MTQTYSKHIDADTNEKIDLGIIPIYDRSFLDLVGVRANAMQKSLEHFNEQIVWYL
jgi:hypothetical protein